MSSTINNSQDLFTQSSLNNSQDLSTQEQINLIETNSAKNEQSDINFNEVCNNDNVQNNAYSINKCAVTKEDSNQVTKNNEAGDVQNNFPEKHSIFKVKDSLAIANEGDISMVSAANDENSNDVSSYSVFNNFKKNDKKYQISSVVRTFCNKKIVQKIKTIKTNSPVKKKSSSKKKSIRPKGNFTLSQCGFYTKVCFINIDQSWYILF